MTGARSFFSARAFALPASPHPYGLSPLSPFHYLPSQILPNTIRTYDALCSSTPHPIIASTFARAFSDGTSRAQANYHLPDHDGQPKDVTCSHKWEKLKTNSTIMQFFCGFCYHGPHYWIYECRYCSVKACQPCRDTR